MKSDDLPDDLGTGMTVITIVIDKAKEVPHIDLGDCLPETAIAIFNKAVESLEMELPHPRITYMGEVFSDVHAMWEDDDDD